MTVPKEVMELVAGSGNSFHARVARWLSENGWHVTISPYYMDQTQGKAREIDLIAERLWPTYDAFGRHENYVAARMFIECKFVAAEAAFWFTDKDRGAAMSLVCGTAPFQSGNSYTNEHHYLATSPRVAKLFASANNKTSENEPFYKALNQALNAMVSMRGRSLTHPDLTKNRRSVVATLDMPVVVCSAFDKLYAVDFFGDTPPTSIAENFQLEVSYAYVDSASRQHNDYFLLDFVSFDKLQEFSGAMEKGAAAAATLSSS